MSPVYLQTSFFAIFFLSCLVGTYLLARQNRLSFRYATGWASLFIFGLFGSFGLGLTKPVAEFLEVTPSAVFAIGGLSILVLICIQLTISISGMQKQVRVLSTELALMNNWTSRNESAASDHTKDSTLIVIPAYNEEGNIQRVVTSLLNQGRSVLVVNDGSIDQTGKEASISGSRVINLPFNQGVGGALRAGFQYAVSNGFGRVVQVDADGQHPIEQIDQLLQVQEDGDFDLVVGSRFSGVQSEMEIGVSRRLAMLLLAKMATRSAGCEIHDATCGFRVIAGQLLSEFSRSFPEYYLGDTFEALVAAGKGGYRITEVPVKIVERQAGLPSASFSQSLRYLTKGFLVSLLGVHIRISPKCQ
jgi:hypothetical protein